MATFKALRGGGRISERSFIENSAYVADTATVDECSYIGNGAYVGFGTTIGKRTLICNLVRIGNNCVIGDDVTMECGNVIPDGAVVLDGTTMADPCCGGGGGGGAVDSVTASAPLSSSGGANPNIAHLVSGATAGTYSNPTSISINATGHVTSASAGMPLISHGSETIRDNDSSDEPVQPLGQGMIVTGPSAAQFIEHGVQDTRDNESVDEPVQMLGQGMIVTGPAASTVISHGVEDTRSNDEPDESTDFMPGDAIPGQSGTVSGKQATLIDGSRTLLAAQGLLGESYDRRARVGSALTVLGTVYYMAVQLYRGDVVANISVGIVATGTLTLAKVAIFDKTGTRLGVSGNVNATFGATGLKTIALTGSVAIPTTDLYYLAVVMVGSAALTMFCHTTAGQSALCASTPVGAGVSPMAIQTGQTDMPSPATFATTNTNAIAMWLGAS